MGAGCGDGATDAPDPYRLKAASTLINLFDVPWRPIVFNNDDSIIEIVFE